MKPTAFISALVLVFSFSPDKENVYIASTPAHRTVRDFLGISLTDSIDFIRWKLVLHSDSYEVQCKYGIGRPNTAGFIDEKKVEFSGPLKKVKNTYSLTRANKTFSILEVNSNVLHLLDDHKNLLVGNGGWSYTLNGVGSVKTDQFNIQVKPAPLKKSMAYEGRTPCGGLLNILDPSKQSVCLKLKWYFIFYADSVTGKPSYYLSDGTAYRKETMTRGKWQMITGKDGRITYKLDPENKTYSIYLLKVDENILYFTDPDGNLLVGDENFSYALNRRTKEYPRIPK